MRPMTPEGSETISISIGLGGDARAASSIVLPRGHDLVRHLERLLPQLAKTVAADDAGRLHYQTTTQPHQHQHPLFQHHHSPTGRSLYAPSVTHRHHPYQQHPRPRTVYAEAPHSPYLSDASSNDSVGPASSSSSSMYDAMARSQTHQLQPLPTHHQLQLQQQQQLVGARRRRGPTGAQGAGKKCQFPECEKISVSRGLCRGHGGGRRCQREGCSKGAQSRSDYCWAHGGGQRCEVKNCMRSRKSKRFCVAHLSWESAPSSELLDSSAAARAYEHPKAIMPKPLAPYPEAYSSPVRAMASPTSLNLPALANASKLPSLQQALRKNQCVGAASTATPFAHAAAAVLNSASG